MNSFYGGRRGSSFEIVKQYATVQEMQQDTTVDYDNYVFVQGNNTIYRRNTTGYEECFTLNIDPTIVQGGTTKLAKYSYMKNNPSEYFPFQSYSWTLEEAQNDEEGDINTKEDGQKLFYCKGVKNGEDFMSIKLPYQYLNFVVADNIESSSLNIVETINNNNIYDKTYTFSLTSTPVSLLSDFREYIVGQTIGDTIPTIYDPNSYNPSTGEYSEKTGLIIGQRILIYQKTYNSAGDNAWFFFGIYNGIKSISLDDETGELTILDYNNTESSFIVKCLNDISLDEGILTFSYNDGDYKNIDFIYPETLSYDNETEQITMTDSQGNESIISPEINYIKRMIITEDYHLIVYFSSPTYRDTYKNYTYEGDDEWIDFGAVKSDSGILIGKNISPEEVALYFNNDTLDLSSHATIIAYLNSLYPTGLQGLDYKGKVVTYGSNDEDKEIYAFDYTKISNEYVKWYYVGLLSAETPKNPTVVHENTSTQSEITEIISNLAVGGIWLVLSS